MAKKNVLVLVGMVFMVVVVVVLFLVVRNFSKKIITTTDSKKTVLTESSFKNRYRIGGIGWEVGELKVKYLGSKIGDGNLYLTGTYHDTDGVEKGVSVLVATLKGKDKMILLSDIKDKDNQSILSGIIGNESLSNTFSVGEEFQVDFLISVPEYKKVALSDFCKKFENVCELGKRTEIYQTSFGNFWNAKIELPSGIPLNAVAIGKQ